MSDIRVKEFESKLVNIIKNVKHCVFCSALFYQRDCFTLYQSIPINDAFVSIFEKVETLVKLISCMRKEL